ncbi:helix-turn-helix domain-containing protein [Providencia sp.]|uniref:helix-turn-helix domain-containing protein n=1 Tax=Providencia sp. TaxID=589 RepID=UPI003F9778E2
MQNNRTLIDLAPLKLVGQKIRDIRRQQGMTGKDLGVLLSISQQHVSRIEKGNVRLNVEQLLHISEVLLITLEELLAGIGYQPKSVNTAFSCSVYHQANSIVILP